MSLGERVPKAPSGPRSSVRTLYFDARCLQDPDYQFRGIGQHSACVISQARNAFSEVGPVRLVAILDRALGPLAYEHETLFDATQINAFATPAAGDWFIALSPMTHSPIHIARMMNRPPMRRAAIIYDFIPLEHPERYLPTRGARIENLTRLSWLNYFDVYLPISEHSGQRLHELLHVPRERIFPSGVAVRGSVVSALGPPPATQRSDYFLVVGGGDARKNPDCPIIAHARSSKLRERRLRLVIAGKYPENMADGLRYLHASHGGDPELLHMLGPVSDQELAEHYRNAILTICPSRAEGFSIPVVEANANGCPVIISNCPAQTELVPFAEDQFDPDDFDRVGALMERVAGNDAARADIINRQKGHWRRFEVRAVGERFWAPMIAMEKNSETHAPVAAPAVLRGAKPTIAIVGPMPPDKSGVADYTAACLESLAKRAEIHIFTETETPTPSAAYASVSKLTPLPYLSSRFDSVITVIGNSHFHIEPLRMLLDYGGPAIAHDARMINFYAILHGPEKAAALATKELGRPVDWPEVEVWLHNQRKLKTLFLSEILDAASPTIVHSRVTQRIIKDMYGKDTVHLPFSQYRELTEAECTSEARIRARKALDVRDGAFLISTFGGVSPDKAPEACLWALQQLVTWGVDAELAFVGHAGEPMAAGLRKLAADLGLTNRVRLFIDTVDEATYRAYLSAADVGVQLRTYALGGLAGGLLDCISAGLPSVANAHLAEAMESPDYVHVVPDGLSPVMMAEQFLALREKFKNGGRPLEARRAYNAGHNFETYCDRLLEQLELAQ